ncbi:MAG: LysR family transcriptional regulator [Gammaproteobacteria bacterium]|nr:LysR family transcriptional regulator [Gammaproteobacteria bacterium]
MRINYDFGDLQAFLAVFEYLSFQRASAELDLSQSAITRRVHKLEQVLGQPLFERTTRRVTPTNTAKQLAIRVAPIIDALHETHLAIHDNSTALAYQRQQTIRIAAVPTLIPGLLVPALHRLRQERPNLRIQIVDKSNHQVAQAVQSAEVDIGLGSMPVLDPGLDFTPITDDRMVVTSQTPIAGANDDMIDWSQLTNLPLIAPAKGTGNRLLLDEAFARKRLQIQWHYEVGRSSTALDLVRAGLGVAIVPKLSLIGADLYAYYLSDPDLLRPIGIIHQQRLSVTPLIAELIEMLKEAH